MKQSKPDVTTARRQPAPWQVVGILFLVALLGISALSVQRALSSHPPLDEGPPGSVILIIADGLGVSMQEALRLVDGPLWIDQMPYGALMRTHSARHVVTDSAAAASAMANGVKANNRAMGHDPDGHTVAGIAALARQANRKVALVTTSYLLDATPGAFVASVDHRSQVETISLQLLEAKPDLLYGGGESQFLPPDVSGRFGPGTRRDNRNMITAFRDAGYHIVDEPTVGPLPQLGLFAGMELFSYDPPHFAPAVSLPAMARAALATLTATGEGFLLVLEEEGTDMLAHRNAVEETLKAARHWNQTVGIALAYQRRHPGTVVIVTADHETGGLQLGAKRECSGPIEPPPGYGTPEEVAQTYRTLLKARNGDEFCARFTTSGHTAEPVGLYSIGLPPPRPIMQNTDVFDMLRQGLRIR